jgi:hypothetical protein
MKKISILALAVIAAVFTAYKAFDDLAKSLEKADINWDEDTDNE